MRFEQRVRLTAAIATLLALTPLGSFGADPMPPTAPGFCFPMTPAQRAGWQSKLGALLGDLHHYCFGLRDMYKAERPGMPKPERDGFLVYAIGEFDYVLNAKNAQKPHWFLPEVHNKKAFALMKLGRYAESQAEFQRARVSQQQAATAQTESR